MGLRSTAVTVQYPGFESELRIHELPVGPDLELVPLLTDPPPQRTDARSYASDLVDRLDPARSPVEAVIAWCTASAIGLEVARLLAERTGTAPVLIALDGTVCTAQHVEQAYQKALGRYGNAGQAAVSLTAAELRSQPAATVAAMRAELTGYASARLLTDPDDPDQAELIAPMVEEVVEVSLDWLIQLIAAHNTEHLPWDGEVIVVTSAQTPFGGSWPNLAGLEVVALDCPAEELIGAPAVAELLNARLAHRAASGA